MSVQQAILAAALAAAACTPEFANPTTISDLRLLVITAEPPEVLVDLPALAAQAAADPAAVEQMLPQFGVTAVVMDPAGAGRAIDYQARVCGNDPLEGSRDPSGRMGRVATTVAQAPCPLGSPLVAGGSVIPAADGSALLPASFRPTVALLTEAVRADPLSIELGLPLKLSFVVRAGDEEVVAVKRVLLSPRLSPTQKPNANPRLQSLLWRLERDQPTAELDETTPLPVARGARIRLLPSYEPGEAEPYEARAFSTSQRRFITESVPAETLRFAFFATRGTFSPGNTNTEPSPLRTDGKADLETVYEAPRQIAGDPQDASARLVHIFVIMRDERAGASVRRARLLLE